MILSHIRLNSIVIKPNPVLSLMLNSKSFSSSLSPGFENPDSSYSCLLIKKLPSFSRERHPSSPIWNTVLRSVMTSSLVFLNLSVVVGLIVPVFADMVSVTKQAFVITEMSIILGAHFISALTGGLDRIVHHLGLSGMLVDMRVYTERTPCVPRHEEVPEERLAAELVSYPYLEVAPFYPWPF